VASLLRCPCGSVSSRERRIRTARYVDSRCCGTWGARCPFDKHTQAREQITFHRKLDEILRALPHADNTLLALEDAPDAALTASRTTHRSLREQALAAANDPRHQTPPTRHIPSRPQTHRPAAAPCTPGSAPNPR